MRRKAGAAIARTEMLDPSHRLRESLEISRHHLHRPKSLFRDTILFQISINAKEVARDHTVTQSKRVVPRSSARRTRSGLIPGHYSPAFIPESSRYGVRPHCVPRSGILAPNFHQRWIPNCGPPWLLELLNATTVKLPHPPLPFSAAIHWSFRFHSRAE